MSQQNSEGFNWQGLRDDTSVTQEAKRYCPEFPFEPALIESATNLETLYQEYELVRIVSADEAYRREVWGFYAPGDFHPLDGSARTFEALNEIAPLNLIYDTVLEYTLLRLRVELACKLSDNEFRLARIVSKVADLPPTETHLATDDLNHLLKDPEVVMAPEWEPRAPANIERGLVFRVVAFAAVYDNAVDWTLRQVFVEIEADGTLTIKSHETDHHGKVPLDEQDQQAVVCTTHRTAIALPFREWQVVGEDEAEQLLRQLEAFGDVAAGFGSSYPDERGRPDIILRRATLRFYKNCELLEILIPGRSEYRRSYVILERDGDKSELYPMRGAPDVIYEINKHGQLDFTGNRVDDYLRFFCWATHGNDGPFYMPQTFREIPLRTAPSKKQCDEVKQIDFGITAVLEGEEAVKTSDIYRKYVAYSSTIFESWFVIEPDGMVKMLKREPRITDLVINKERYGYNLIALARPPKTTGSQVNESPDALDQQFRFQAPEDTDVDPEELRKQQEVLREALSRLSLASKVVLYEHLTNLQYWLRAPIFGEPLDQPKIDRRLRKILEDLFDDNTLQNSALQFLKAQLQSSSKPNISAGLWQDLDTLISAIRPADTATAETLRSDLSQTGQASFLLVAGEIVLNTECIAWREFENAEDAIASHPHEDLLISGCWFTSQVTLTRFDNGPSVSFRDCVFEQGVFAREADMGKDLQFLECVFLGDVAAVNLENARIAGDLRLDRCQLEGAFFAPRLRAENHVQLVGCGIGPALASISEPLNVPYMIERPWPDTEIQFEQDPSPWSIEAINLAGATIGGNLEIRATRDYSQATVIEGSINGDDISVGQSMVMFGTSIEKGISFARAHVAKVVDMSPLRILDGQLDLQSAVVEGDVYLRDANIGGAVNLYQVTVGSNLSLLGLKTRGNLELIFANVRGFVAAYHTSTDAGTSGLLVRGDLILSGTEARMLELRGATITGKLRVITGKFGRFVMAFGTVPAGAETGEVKFAVKPCSASVVEISSVVVEENLDLSGLVVQLPDHERKASRLRMDHQGNAVLLNNSQVGRDLTFFSERVRVSLERRWKDRDEKSLPWQKIPTLDELRSTAWGNLVLKSNEIGGALDLRHLNVTGNIYLNDTNVEFDVNMDAGDPDFDGFRTTCNSIHAAKLECSGDLKLSGINVNENFLARQGRIKGEIVFLPSQTKERAGRGGAVAFEKISPASIGRDLDLSSVEVVGDLDLRNLTVGGDILINDTNVGLDLNMDGNSFAGYATECNNVNAEGLQCHGEVKLSGLRARGDFRGRSMEVGSDIAFLVPEQTTNDEANTNACLQRRGFANIGGYIDLTAAKANRLTLSGDNLCAHLRAADLDLTKLREDLRSGKRRLDRYLINRLPPSAQQGIQNGSNSTELQETIVSELNRLLPGECLSDRKRLADVALSKEVRRLINTARGHTARLNRRLLEECYAGDQQKLARVRLERSTIGYLRIWKPPVLGRVNLSGISVTTWIFSDSANNNQPEPVSGNDYIDILNGMTPFDQSAWIDVEKALRNQSLTTDANKVYREMRKRINNDTGRGPLLSVTQKPVGLLRRIVPDWLGRLGRTIKEGFATAYRELLKPTLWHLWDRLQYTWIGYGTKVWIPMIPALILLIISVSIFRKPEYVRASPSLLQVLQPEGNTEVNLEKSPTQVRGVTWTWRDGAVLSLRYHVPILTSLTHGWWEASSKPLFLGFTAEHYAFIVEAYHWIAWPIFLLGAAAQIFRGRQN